MEEVNKRIDLKPGMFIGKSGKVLKPDPDSPEWKEYLNNIAQTAMVTYKMFGIPDVESHKDYMGIVSVVINTFMLPTAEEKASYATALLEHSKGKKV